MMNVWAVHGCGASNGTAIVSTQRWKEVRGRLLDRVRQIISGIRRAEFPMVNADEHCTGNCPFRTVCRVVAGLSGGAWLNVGSAVLLPEVFLKAVSLALNLGADLDDLLTANFDMFDLYRPRTNVVNRPSGKGFQIIGRHEIMLPLLRLALIAPDRETK